MRRLVNPARRCMAVLMAAIMTLSLATGLFVVEASASEPAPFSGTPVRGSNYRNLSLNPGANNSEMRFTWHSGSPTGAIFIGGDIYREVIFDATGGTIVQPLIQMMAANDSQTWMLVSESTTRVEAHRGLGAMGVDTTMVPTRPGFTYYLHQVSVYDLPFDTEFAYRILWDITFDGNGDAESWDGESTPKTFRTGGSDSFRFLIAGDPQIGVGDGLAPSGTYDATIDGREWTNTVDIATRTFPDAGFILSVGDQIHSSNYVANHDHVVISQYRHDRMFSPRGLHNLPLIGVAGNHDGWSSLSAGVPTHNNANPRLWPMHYNIPAPDTVGVSPTHPNVFRHRTEFYTQFDYWVRWGNTLFFVIDSNGADSGIHRVMSGDRLQFLEDAVAYNTNPNHPDGPVDWLVATFHHPAFCVYRISGATEKTQVIQNFLPHLHDLNFDLVLTGHAHVYARTHQMILGDYQLEQYWLDANANIVGGGLSTEATNAVLDPTGMVHITFNSSSGSGYYNVTWMANRSYISTFNQNFRRNFSVAEVTPYSFSIRTYQVNNNGSHTLVDVYTIVRRVDDQIPVSSTRQMDDEIFERITPIARMDAEHGVPATPEGLGLPLTVGIETNLMNNVGGNTGNIRPPNAQAAADPYHPGTAAWTQRADVVWDIVGSGYNPAYTGRQNLTVVGTVATLPPGIAPPANMPLTIEVQIRILADGEVFPGDIARWMAYGRPFPNPLNLPPEPGGMDYFFWNHDPNEVAARVPNIPPTYGAENVHVPMQFWVGTTQRLFNWESGAPTVTAQEVGGPPVAWGGLGTPRAMLNDLYPANNVRWQTVVSTQGRAGIEVQFDWRSDATGPGHWQLEFSIDGDNWIPAGAPITLTGTWQTNFERTLPEIANDQERLYIRWRMTSNTTAAGGAILQDARHHMRNIIIRSTVPLIPCDPDCDCELCFVDERMRIDVLMFTDFHGHIEAGEPVPENPGAARLAAYIEYQRQQNPSGPDNVIVVGGGDEFHGYSVSTLTGGAAVLEMMGHLAYHSPAQNESGIHMALGNHEFSFGPERARYFGNHDNVTLLAADLFYTPNSAAYNASVAAGRGGRPDFVRPFDVIEFPDHNITIALVGLMTDNMHNLVSGWAGHGFEARTPAPGRPLAYRTAIADLISYLRNTRGVAAVIGVTHMPGNSAAMNYVADNLGFDALVGGHLHVLVNRTRNDVPIIEAQHHGRTLGRFSLMFNESGQLEDVVPWVSPANAIRDFTRPVAAAMGVADHYDTVAGIIQPYLESTYDYLRAPLGPHGIYFADRVGRNVWVSRLVLDYVTRWAQATPNESPYWIGISNYGGWRNTGFWPRGADQSTNRAQLISTMPFDGGILLFEMYGRDVLELLGTTVTGGGGVPVNSGIHQAGNYWYLTATGNRITDNGIYNVLSRNFTFGGLGVGGGDGFPFPGNNQGIAAGMTDLSGGQGPRVLMQDGSTMTWTELMSTGLETSDWDYFGVSSVRGALIDSTLWREATPNDQWQAELTVVSEDTDYGTAAITFPFAPGDRSRNMNIIPQWVTVTATPRPGYQVAGWFNVGDAADATPLSTSTSFSFAIAGDTNLEVRFEPGGIPPISIAEARLAVNSGEQVTVQGYITGTVGAPAAGAMQDVGASGPNDGIIVSLGSAAGFMGQRIQVTGYVQEIAGNLRITSQNTTAVGNNVTAQVVNANRIQITPIPVTLADLANGGFHGMLVSVAGVELQARTDGATVNHPLVGSGVMLRTNLGSPTELASAIAGTVLDVHRGNVVNALGGAAYAGVTLVYSTTFDAQLHYDLTEIAVADRVTIVIPDNAPPSIAPNQTFEFDVNDPDDVEINFNLGIGNLAATTIASVAQGSTPLQTTDWSIDGTTLTIYEDFFTGISPPLEGGDTVALTITFNDTASTAPIVNVNIIDSAVDKTALEALISVAAIRVPANNTDASWTPFAAALGEARAVIGNSAATQQQVDNARTELQTRLNGLQATLAPAATVAWAGTRLNTSHGNDYAVLATGTAWADPLRYDTTTRTVTSAPGTAGLRFIVDGEAQPRVLTIGSGGLNVRNAADSGASGLDGLAGRAYWITEVSTIGLTNIEVLWSMRSTATGPRDWQLQYSTDGIAWHNVGAVSQSAAPAAADGVSLDGASHNARTLPSTAENQQNLWIRWLMTSDTSVNDATTGAGGTHQIGNIRIGQPAISGSSLPLETLALTDDCDCEYDEYCDYCKDEPAVDDTATDDTTTDDTTTDDTTADNTTTDDTATDDTATDDTTTDDTTADDTATDDTATDDDSPAVSCCDPPVTVDDDESGDTTATGGHELHSAFILTPLTAGIGVSAVNSPATRLNFASPFSAGNIIIIDESTAAAHVLHGTSVGLLPTAVRTGYRFLGWFTERDGGGVPFTADTEVTANIRVFAYWVSEDVLEAWIETITSIFAIADDLAATTRISVNGSDVAPADFWVTQQQMNTFTGILEALRDEFEYVVHWLDSIFIAPGEVLAAWWWLVFIYDDLVYATLMFADQMRPGTRGAQVGNGDPPSVTLPPPAATPDDDLAPAVPPPTEEENHDEIMDQLEDQLEELEEGETPEITLTLPEGVDDALLSAETIEMLVEAEATLSIVSGIVTVTVGYDFLDALLEEESVSFIVRIAETIHDEDEAEEQPDEDEIQVFVTAEITIIRDGEEVEGVGIPYTITVDMTGFDLEDLNPARIVLLVDGQPLGGTFDPETGQFVIETVFYTGTFEIVYVPTLRRINMALDSPLITDVVYGDTTVMDVFPAIVDGRTMIPARFITESLGADVQWDTHNHRAVIVLNGRELILAPGQMLPGMDVPAFIEDGRMMLPLRFVAEFFGATVIFHEDSRGIEIIL